MSSILSNLQGFVELEKEGADFINYVIEKSNSPFSLNKQSEFEQILDMLEKHLRIKGKANGDIQLLLYKVLKIKKLLKKLHKCLNDIEKNTSEYNEQAINKAICGDVSFEELEEILNEKMLPNGDFYNYNGIRNVLKRKLNGEIDEAFFKSWLILLCRVLNGDKFDFISNYFDACSFYNEYDSKEVFKIMATLKDFNYKLMHNDFMLRHKREKLRVIYLRFLHFNRSADSSIFKAYFVDYKNKKFDIRIIDDALFDYRDDLMYCDLWSKYFDEDGEYIDSDGEYDSEPAELIEEIQLMNLFYDEEWTYDHELNF